MPELLPLPLPSDADRDVAWPRLYGSADALAIAESARQFTGTLVVIAPDTMQAQRLESALDFYLDADDGVPLLHFPDWETLPYDSFSPHQDIISERLSVLARLPETPRGVLVVPVTTLMHRLPPAAFVRGNTFDLESGQTLDIEPFRQRLEQAGYRCVSQVMEHGEFAVRGSLFDLYPMGSPLPYRIDLFDDEVETIRVFDPETQRTRETVNHIKLLPAREFPQDDAAIKRFRQNWREALEGDPSQCPVYREVSEGNAPAGIEYYLPLFFEQTNTLFDYLPGDCLVVQLEGIAAAINIFDDEVTDRHEQYRHDRERPVLPVERLFMNHAELDAQLSALPRIAIDAERNGIEASSTAPPALPINAQADEPLAMLQNHLGAHPGRSLLIAESAGRRETLLELLRNHDIRPTQVDNWKHFQSCDDSLCITVHELALGLSLREPPLSVITENQLFGERAMQKRRRRTSRDAESIVRDLTELTVGAPVVHEDKGVGRYLGLQTLTVGDITTEFLALEYAGGDKLYVPVSSLHLISRYTGAEPDSAPLHKLGTQQWAKAKKKAMERIHDVAAELLDINARRAARQGRQFPLESSAYQLFCEGFPFEETPDQEQSIEAVIDDMTSSRPMDRLVCGDVGFGKTEVAMRAAFVAVQAGTQVAVLVPTTLLAQQHYQSFADRFADWPVRVEQLSRFRSKKQQDAALAELAAGKADIVIGTHKLLQNGVRFKNLGLVIIDEEHRFGVRHKERFKSLRAEVDVLTLTATPIPRTLNMAMSGVRDLSIIATAPEKRLSVKTFVREWNGSQIREACLREMKRGGQIFFLHNKVETIEKTAREMEELLPEATIGIAHGQMRERELEQVMLDFYHRRYNVLVCTTIIETGIDVPNANTIVINRADRFGLAQLHQLRGRVGRSHHRAYAYLVVPPKKAMTADAVRRLEAIESLEDLGIGFTLATHDLEIRGAGEILGSEQSGQIHDIGYALYSELLERAVSALKAGQNPQLERPLERGTEIDLHTAAIIPDTWLPDVHSRLILYKRIANAKTAAELRELQVEMIDRFGLLPEATRVLFRITEIKLQTTALGIAKVDLGPSGGRIEFTAEPHIDPANLVRLIQSQAAVYRLDGSDKLRVSMQLDDVDERIDALLELIEELTVKEAA